MKIQHSNYVRNDPTIKIISTINRQLGYQKSQMRQGIPMLYNKFRLKINRCQTEINAQFIPDTG